LADKTKGFPIVTKTLFKTIDATATMMEEKLFYDEVNEDRYSYGKWYLFPIKGILSPTNNWF